MSQILRDCGELGDTLAVGRCRWCGAKLRPYRYREAWPEKQLGDYGDGHFCGLRCGYRFGLRHARDGRRVFPAPRKKGG